MYLDVHRIIYKGVQQVGENHFFERIPFSFDLPSEPLPGQPIVELAGCGRVLIENHFGVTEYSCQSVCVKVKYGYIHICGDNLKIVRMSKQRLVICGSVESISLHRRK